MDVHGVLRGVLTFASMRYVTSSPEQTYASSGVSSAGSWPLADVMKHAEGVPCPVPVVSRVIEAAIVVSPIVVDAVWGASAVGASAAAGVAAALGEDASEGVSRGASLAAGAVEAAAGEGIGVEPLAGISTDDGRVGAEAGGSVGVGSAWAGPAPKSAVTPTTIARSALSAEGWDMGAPRGREGTRPAATTRRAAAAGWGGVRPRPECARSPALCAPRSARRRD